MLSYLWGGARAADAKPENENAELAMRDQLDEHGDFATKLDGTLEFQDFIYFRAVVLRQSLRMFQEARDTLQAKRLEAFKAKDQQAYVKTFREQQMAYQKCLSTMTRKACEWIEIDLTNYNLAHKTYMEDEAKRSEVQKKDSEVRKAIEAKEITQSIEDVVTASKFKFKRDMEMFRKLQSLKFTTSPQAQAEIQAIEMSKTSDALTEEFGFDLSHLTYASQHFKLEDNEEIKSFRKLVIAQKESEEKAEFDRAMPPKEVIDALIEEGKTLGEPEYKSDGTMTFDYFLSTSKIVIKYTINQTQEGLMDHQEIRRKAIADGDEEQFQKLVLKTANWEQLTNTLIQANLYQSLKVPKNVFEKSAQVYLMEPSKRTIYEEEIQALRDAMRKKSPKELTREQVLDSVKLLEAAKFEAQKKMYQFVRESKVAPQMINAVIKVEKLKADDKFFNETGIEEEDVEPNLKRLGLEEDEEFKAIVAEWQKKSDDFLASKKDETAALLQKAEAAKKHLAAQKAKADAEKAAK
jgi:hypothetical protein